MEKLCKCGCGQKTQLSWDKKRYNDYINYHSSKGIKKTKDQIEEREISRIYNDLKRELGIPLDYDYPLCGCGCNKKVKHKNDKYITNHQPSSMGMLGKKFSKETLEKLSKIRTGIVFTKERKDNISKKLSGSLNPQFGKKISEETRDKLRESHRGIKSSADNITKRIIHLYIKVINLDTEEIFNSITEAAAKYNLDRSAISKVCRGKLLKTGNYRWSYLGDFNNEICSIL